MSQNTLLDQNQYWKDFKLRNYQDFRMELYERMIISLTCQKFSELNEIGIFHNVKDKMYWNQMKIDAESGNYSSWISKGVFFGIWTTLFSPETSFTFVTNPIQYMIRFRIMADYCIYNPNDPLHVALWNQFMQSPDFRLPNSWENPQRLAERLKDNHYPFHSIFFEKYHIAGLIGYSDYVSFVLLNPNAIAKTDFFEYPV